ncbi:tRNA uridine-5-carboxymethylaminomethyl(34) synthesis enzyme MnmG [Candidatus Babeliales bacterium]|nr:tRNA uridine-5-carboxymethylaminomethyl(34) synthesis enzyme MnmG [Candidatus Babeliales bacterium]
MKNNSNIFDVIVIGAGHAGIEAAHAAAKMGSYTLLLTIDVDKIALCPCNPSIGGLGKGHIVYEISAFGGLMPKLCSLAYLQARMLNTSKGPAVQGLRLQIDKYAYSKKAKEILLQIKNLTIESGLVTEILTENTGQNKKIIGVKTQDNKFFSTKSIIITSGTFLNGVTFIGNTTKIEGRIDEVAVHGLTESLEKILDTKLNRLKTGTPPRLLKSSVNFDVLEKQEATNLDYLFEFDEIDVKETVACYITQTNEKTHEIIKKNLHKSALYGGLISGIGPRYCPSIEDKIKRHPQRNSHHVFVEPEGGDFTQIYPAGLSTSLPLDVQDAYIKSIKGFENAIIEHPGYAVEYDFLQPNNLKHSLESKTVDGLFFAGQINGTTGYEEAAGQGIIAGINAHLRINNKEAFILNRTESYIGVMIDDLITLGVDEPYRMFTSRAERRLLLRQDNVFLRLMPYGKQLGLIDDKVYSKFLKEKEIIEKSIELVSQNRNKKLFNLFHDINFEQTKDIAKEYLFEELKKLDNNIDIKNISSRALLCIHAHIRYSGYIEKEEREIEKTIKFQNLEIPANIIFDKIPGLSIEMQQKLKYHKPKSIAQAQLIPGMTPAAISILIFQIRLI